MDALREHDLRGRVRPERRAGVRDQVAHPAARRLPRGTPGHRRADLGHVGAGRLRARRHRRRGTSRAWSLPRSRLPPPLRRKCGADVQSSAAEGRASPGVTGGSSPSRPAPLRLAGTRAGHAGLGHVVEVDGGERHRCDPRAALHAAGLRHASGHRGGGRRARVALARTGGSRFGTADHPLRSAAPDGCGVLSRLPRGLGGAAEARSSSVST